MSADDSTRAVVERMLAALATGDLEEVGSCYASAVDWRLDWPADRHGGDIPWIRARSTRDDVVEHYRTIAEHHDPAAAGTEVERILVDGDDAVVLGTIRGRMRRSARSYEARFALHLTVRNGSIVRHHVYEDSLAVDRAWAGA